MDPDADDIDRRMRIVAYVTCVCGRTIAIDVEPSTPRPAVLEALHREVRNADWRIYSDVGLICAVCNEPL